MTTQKGHVTFDEDQLRRLNRSPTPPKGAGKSPGGYTAGSKTANGFERKRGGNNLNPLGCLDVAYGSTTICGQSHERKQKK